MRRKAGETRTFTETEQQWLREHWTTKTNSLEAMAAHLRCRIPVLKREAKILGLMPRGTVARTVKAGELHTKRKYNKRADAGPNRGCERVRNVDGERESPPPEGILYACPNPACGFRCASPLGHPRCVEKVA
jgi:hypothetical protein